MNLLLTTITSLLFAHPPGPDGEGRPPHPPPLEAIEACADADAGDDCSFESPHGTLEGTCHQTPRDLVCVPDGAPPPPPPPEDDEN